jgi:hypothetical protein
MSKSLIIVLGIGFMKIRMLILMFVVSIIIIIIIGVVAVDLAQ